MDRDWEDAVKRADVEIVVELLRAGADINSRDRYGQTALMLATRAGNLELVQVLVAYGADLNATAKYNLSALMLAVIGGHQELARILAHAGADLCVKGSGAPGFAGKTAHDLAVARGMTKLSEELMPQ